MLVALQDILSRHSCLQVRERRKAWKAKCSSSCKRRKTLSGSAACTMAGLPGCERSDWRNNEYGAMTCAEMVLWHLLLAGCFFVGCFAEILLVLRAQSRMEHSMC